MKNFDKEFAEKFHLILMNKLSDKNYDFLENVSAVEAALVAFLLVCLNLRSLLLKSPNPKTRKKHILEFRDTIIDHFKKGVDKEIDKMVEGLKVELEKDMH